MLDRISSLKPTPLFPPIVEVTKVDLKEIVEDNVVELFMIKKYLFVILYDMFNATYNYNLTVFNTENWNKTYVETFLKSRIFEKINLFYDEDELVIISKRELLYIHVVDENISKTVIGLESSELFIDSYLKDGYIIILTNIRLFVFGYGSLRITSFDSESIGSILKARIRQDKLILATQNCKPSCSLYVMKYSVVNDTLTLLNKLKIDLNNPITNSKIYLDLEYIEIIDSGRLIVSSLDGNITYFNLVPADSVLFESFYDKDIFLVTQNKTSKALTYWFFRSNLLFRKLDLIGEDSIYTFINISVGYRFVYDEEAKLITIYGFTSGMLIHELVGDESFIRMLYLIHTTGYERIDNVILFPNYRIFLVTSEKLGIERYAYLYTIDANFVYNLGYLVTRPGVNVVNDRLTIAFITLEYGARKILICFIDKPAVLLLRGIKSSITYRDQYNRSVTYLYGGGAADLVILPSNKGFLRVVSRTCYDGPEDLYEQVEVDLRSDKLNFINTTIYSAQLAYTTSATINALFIDKHNSTRIFSVTFINSGVCYIPPGDYVIEAHRIETGLIIKTSLKINANDHGVINFDELFNHTYASPSLRNKNNLVIISILLFIVIILVLFIRSIIMYRKQASLYS